MSSRTALTKALIRGRARRCVLRMRSSAVARDQCLDAAESSCLAFMILPFVVILVVFRRLRDAHGDVDVFEPRHGAKENGKVTI